MCITVVYVCITVVYVYYSSICVHYSSLCVYNSSMLCIIAGAEAGFQRARRERNGREEAEPPGHDTSKRTSA